MTKGTTLPEGDMKFEVSVVRPSGRSTKFTVSIICAEGECFNTFYEKIKWAINSNEEIKQVFEVPDNFDVLLKVSARQTLSAYSKLSNTNFYEILGRAWANSRRSREPEEWAAHKFAVFIIAPSRRNVVFL